MRGQSIPTERPTGVGPGKDGTLSFPDRLWALRRRLEKRRRVGIAESGGVISLGETGYVSGLTLDLVPGDCKSLHDHLRLSHRKEGVTAATTASGLLRKSINNHGSNGGFFSIDRHWLSPWLRCDVLHAQAARSGVGCLTGARTERA
jgi:hypothetical protein